MSAKIDYATLNPATGCPDPLGATVLAEGVNFSVFSKYAEAVELLLFAGACDARPAAVIPLDPVANRTNYYWHILVPKLGHGQVYAWRVAGPDSPAEGHRFAADKVLLDPYGKGVTGLEIYDRQAARIRGDNCARAMRSVVIDSAAYDWDCDRPLPRPEGREVIYEMHLAGFTKSPSSGLDESIRGTYAGVIQKIPYLVELGVTAVEFLPVHQFDPQDAPEGRLNYWGYSSVSWFAPHCGYSSDRGPTGPVREFRDMVKALHRAGLRVILDVVYNHTAEGGADGPTLSWRGFENHAYYLLQEDRSRYADFTGCGNTINANHSIVRRQILDSLDYWVREMHVDGFRFDLASVLSRGEDGTPLKNAPILWAIESDPILAGTRLIAEAWDAAGLYQVGSFTGGRFAEWNGPFRDDVRRFLRGDTGTIERLMARLVGSPDLFSEVDDSPSHSVNYVTCHDGFCLADLVAYEQKQNLDNGEQNRDGSNNNLSWNCGVEGPTDIPDIQQLRRQQVRNFLSILFLSHGEPLLLMGDELGHTRRGNNNPWCQDNDLNWLNWQLAGDDNNLLKYTRQLVEFTSQLQILQENRFWKATSPTATGDISWHGAKTGEPDWSPESRAIAYSLEHQGGAERLHVVLNSHSEDSEFELPALPRGERWLRIIDTSREAPETFRHPTIAPPIDGKTIAAPAHSVVVLLADSHNMLSINQKDH